MTTAVLTAAVRGEEETILRPARPDSTQVTGSLFPGAPAGLFSVLDPGHRNGCTELTPAVITTDSCTHHLPSLTRELANFRRAVKSPVVRVARAPTCGCGQ